MFLKIKMQSWTITINFITGFNTNINSEYFTYDKLNNLISNDTLNFSLFPLNVRSLFLKHDEIYAMLENIDWKFDSLCVSETFLNSEPVDMIDFCWI